MGAAGQAGQHEVGHVGVGDGAPRADPRAAAPEERVGDKTGVRSRRDLVGKIFFAHYEPRFRDNERRVDDNKPVRGGPRR